MQESHTPTSLPFVAHLCPPCYDDQRSPPLLNSPLFVASCGPSTKLCRATTYGPQFNVKIGLNKAVAASVWAILLLPVGVSHHKHWLGCKIELDTTGSAVVSYPLSLKKTSKLCTREVAKVTFSSVLGFSSTSPQFLEAHCDASDIGQCRVSVKDSGQWNFLGFLCAAPRDAVVVNYVLICSPAFALLGRG